MEATRRQPSSLWHNSDFLKLWGGRTISELGSRITREGIPLTAVLMLGASPVQLGILSALGSAPVLLVGLLAGVWVDRVRRRPLLIGVDLARAALLATIPLAAATNALHIWQLYVVIALAGGLAVLFEIADQSYLPTLVERDHLLEGNSKLGASESVAEIAGPALAGGLIQLLTAPIAIAFDALSFVVSAVSVGLIRRPEPAIIRPPEAASGVWREIGEGLRLVLGDPILRPLAAATATRTFFGNFIGALYAVFAVRTLGMTPALLGLLISLGGVGALPGALLAGATSRRFGLGPTLTGSLLIGGLISFLTPLAPGPTAAGPAPLAVLFLALPQLFGDCSMVIYLINAVSLRQIVTPDHLLGRMNASMRTLVGGLSPLGALTGGLLGEVIGLRATLLIAALGSLLSVSWLLWSPVRNLRQVSEEKPEHRFMD